ncbi:MAG: hypothetical protein PUB39_01990 [Eubacteriales bacterium]|nr:hypothetical protein [Eubacteriales bacterium]
MTAIEDVLEIEYARKDIEDYREKLIAGSYTDMFLKASFLVEKRKVTAYYKTAGYKSILRCRTDFSKLVKISASLMEKMEEAEHMYFLVGGYHVTPELLFIEKHTGQPKLIYEKAKLSGWNETKYDLMKLFEPGNFWNEGLNETDLADARDVIMNNKMPQASHIMRNLERQLEANSSGSPLLENRNLN